MPLSVRGHLPLARRSRCVVIRGGLSRLSTATYDYYRLVRVRARTSIAYCVCGYFFQSTRLHTGYDTGTMTRNSGPTKDGGDSQLFMFVVLHHPRLVLSGVYKSSHVAINRLVGLLCGVQAYGLYIVVVRQVF